MKARVKVLSFPAVHKELWNTADDKGIVLPDGFVPLTVPEVGSVDRNGVATMRVIGWEDLDA